ncbi:MAG TPA: MotA/TolQ/ExbB proton channel family protein [Bacteroidales bacterium]|jgi:biopolymer transport protein ExbB|nr:MotA/TolQ/ExbB proton channel family protein [Bacteroidales bacterium]MDY0160432.1 MotA/TolQ/ExbB proton channel family protein [Bacteroidales bacterium]HXK81488.1 MotA/TolQ/ExbB proton channel family protein [Bacteroidales bacterium]
MILLQAQAVDTVSNAAESTGELSMSLFELAVQGGVVMIILAVLSVIAIYIFFDKFMMVRKASKINPGFMENIKNFIHEGKVESALDACRMQTGPLARMLEKGVMRIGRPLSDINTTIENVGKQEISKLEKGLALLATISGGAPMIGFLGTVIGMIQAFYNMANAGNNIDITLLSGGIYTAMVTTVGGLIVGIVAYFAYNIIVARIDNLVAELETRTTEFMDILNEPAN